MLKRFSGILLTVALLGAAGCAFPAAASANLLQNGGFEAVDSARGPEGWTAEFWREGSVFEATTEKAHSGKYSLKIKSAIPNDARMVQTVAVKPDTVYRLSGWAAAEEVTPGKIGANLSVIVDEFVHSQPLSGTVMMTPLELNFKTAPRQTEAKIAVRLGNWGDEVTGAAYFDDIQLEELKTEPASLVTIADKSGATNASGTGGPALILIGLGIAIGVGVILWLLLFRKKSVPKAASGK